MNELKVERKGHTRRAYLRKDGTRVKSTQVSSSTAMMPDKGKKGRTPKRRRWFEPQIRTGWGKDQPVNDRRDKVLSAHGGDELASARAMQALANVTTDRETKKEARSDARYFYGRYKGMKGASHKRSGGRRMPRITPKQPKLRR